MPLETDVDDTSSSVDPGIVIEAVAHINRVAPDFIASHPELPGAQMRVMRNVVIHQYFAVDTNVLWTTVKDDLPRLKP